MSQGKKSPNARIDVTDQVGKHHVVIRYVQDVDANPDDVDLRGENENAIEYRLGTGISVEKTGSDTFRTADGKLNLTAL